MPHGKSSSTCWTITINITRLRNQQEDDCDCQALATQRRSLHHHFLSKFQKQHNSDLYRTFPFDTGNCRLVNFMQ